jgi:hypothetical protein
MRTALLLLIFGVLIAVVLLQDSVTIAVPRASGRASGLISAVVVLAMAATAIVLSASRLLQTLP